MELKAYVHADYRPYMPAGEKYAFCVFSIADMSGSGYQLVKEITLDIETPSERELDLKTVEVLKKRLSKVRADCYREEEAIQSQIDNLLAIENKVSA